MGAFGIGTNTSKTDSGKIKGRRLDIACDCWFTSTGKTIPRMIKFIDENGEMQTVTEIHLNHTEKKNFSGIPSKEYLCTIRIDNMQYDVKLIFFLEECKWAMYFI